MHMCEVCKAIKRFETLESPLIAGDYWVGRLDGRPAILSGEGQGFTPVGYRYMDEGEAVISVDGQHVWSVGGSEWQAGRAGYGDEGLIVDGNDDGWEWCMEEPPCLSGMERPLGMPQ